MYNIKAFKWWIREDELGSIIDALTKLIEDPNQTLLFMKTLTGKLGDVKLMIPEGKFYFGQLVKESTYNCDADMGRIVQASDWCRSEALFWRIFLPFCSKMTTTPDPAYQLPSWSLHAFPDSAGGSMTTEGAGMGAVIFPDWWTYTPWGRAINSGQLYKDGKRLASNMSALELVGPLAILCGASSRVRGQDLIMWVDNSGSVAIYEKGWCESCMLCTTLVLAISQVAASLQCQLEIRKIKRCSNAGSVAADAISKAEFANFRKIMPLATRYPAELPRVLTDWLQNPVETRWLGRDIIREMRSKQNITGIDIYK